MVGVGGGLTPSPPFTDEMAKTSFNGTVKLAHLVLAVTGCVVLAAGMAWGMIQARPLHADAVRRSEMDSLKEFITMQNASLRREITIQIDGVKTLVRNHRD